MQHKGIIRFFGGLRTGRDVVFQFSACEAERSKTIRSAQAVCDIDYFSVTAPPGPMNLKDICERLNQRQQSFVIPVRIQNEFLSAADREQIIDTGVEILRYKALLFGRMPTRETERVITDITPNHPESQYQIGCVGFGGKRGAQVRHPKGITLCSCKDQFGKHFCSSGSCRLLLDA